MNDADQSPEALANSVTSSRDTELGPTARANDLPPARILVADDQEEIRVVLQRLLQREGYVVDCADNGRAALEMAASQPYDMFLLDITMPEVDGYQVLEELKERAATRDIPVIMISAVDDLASVARCVERGADDHLSKPFQPVLLRARIRACLEKKRLRDLEKEHLQRVNQVIDAAGAVESGTYQAGSLAQVAARADELGRLARVFNKMAAEVKAREERLVKQVRDLKAEIEKASPRAMEVRRSSSSMQRLELFSGQLFAERYEILEKLGSGGMGVVYKAHDRKLDEDIAIKRLDPELLERSASAAERFKSEIRLARRISHRNVVRTHDFGEWDGTYYLTMEYVEGITVRELIDTRGQVGISSALAIGSQLAQSLDIAHKVGVIHRDIKPANLLLDEAGVLKVMDFGVACLAERTGSRKRGTGMIVGTPAYMAPEQLLGGDVDARSDLYSAGVVLYECLTGRLPFEADDLTSLTMKVLEEHPPSPSVVSKDVPPSFSALVLRLLALEPDRRLGSAAELADQLEHIT
ncbi:MAG: protein kinase [Gemmatimonadetes bacterium]|nr:protein kinase [Gemmatimonadota bacterium]